jgi:ubiquinone/menaquinone biosynthesis C-methylase UbiE
MLKLPMIIFSNTTNIPSYNKVLNGFYRILKKNGKLFIIVRSVNDWEANLKDSSYDSKTGMITYPIFVANMKKTKKTATRCFHSKKSIKLYVMGAGFKIAYIKEYNEQLYHDYMRTIKTPKLTSLIEITGLKQ